jgi:cytoskeletal protein CcmA (bactofilin family)
MDIIETKKWENNPNSTNPDNSEQNAPARTCTYFGDIIMKNKYLILAMAILPFTFVGCDNGGSSGVSGTTSTPTGVVYGRIDGFGSIHVDNRRLITDDNTLVVIGDDNPVVWDDSMTTNGTLMAGQIAMVAEDNGHADRVTIDETVRGPVDSTNPLVVMGQTVVQGAGTLVDNNCPPDLLNADVVEVYGLADANGAIEANIIECKTSAEVKNYSVIGKAINIGASAFDINGLTVDYSSADTSDLSGGKPQEGQLVQVKDSNKLYIAGSAILSATKIEPQASPGSLASTNEHVEIESYVTDISGLPDSFKIDDLTINISGTTTFLFGDATMIVNGVKLEAEGHINSNGELDASKIKFENNDARIDAIVSATDPVNNSITLLDGTVTVFTDDSTQVNNNVTLPISVNDSIEVRGYIGSNGNFVASEVRDGSGNPAKPEIRGTATNLDATAGTMEILGITIITDSSTEFKGHDNNLMTRDAFFAAVVADVTTVQAKWDSYTGDLSIPVKELELEDD